MPCLCYAELRNAFATQSYASPLLRYAERCEAFAAPSWAPPLLCRAEHCLCYAERSTAFAVLRSAKRRTAFAVLCGAKRCHCSLHFREREPPLAAVAPLPQPAQCAVTKPRLDVGQ